MLREKDHVERKGSSVEKRIITLKYLIVTCKTGAMCKHVGEGGRKRESEVNNYLKQILRTKLKI